MAAMMQISHCVVDKGGRALDCGSDMTLSGMRSTGNRLAPIAECRPPSASNVSLRLPSSWAAHAANSYPIGSETTALNRISTTARAIHG
jgi:hypothetical protein